MLTGNAAVFYKGRSYIRPRFFPFPTLSPMSLFASIHLVGLIHQLAVPQNNINT